MNIRTAQKHTELVHMNVGPAFKVAQPFPTNGLEAISPFILLHHAGPQQHAPGALQARLSPHPHRGFEPVTFLFSGKLHHKDSTGAEGYLESGDVQWMTAGSGIIHSEGPSAAFAEEGGRMELVQLWVNLPRAEKMTPPKYQDIKRASIPVVERDGFRMQVVAGTFEGNTGPASTFTPILALMVHFDGAGKIEVPVPQGWNALAYVLKGAVRAGGTDVTDRQTAVFRHDGDTVLLEAQSEGYLLLLAGAPIDEPMVSYGPFVMNYPGEIKQAILDYESGRMGVLES
ncbi:pirin family protein [Flaviaesturariibacter aridisoli]|uniref:Pirin family protein n=1 Tax=Flaviaesturariibacter aridisoli TaxID=2545761 RepID=A0A4R4E7C9_9BACT|nr:pirin family protein [Flaviaesturariibacter aridisoli]TCZ73951.1 pirin family protein [Flaviaesturariibacter aridisoli]